MDEYFNAVCVPPSLPCPFVIFRGNVDYHLTTISNNNTSDPPLPPASINSHLIRALFIRRLVSAFQHIGIDELQRAFALCEVSSNQGTFEIAACLFRSAFFELLRDSDSCGRVSTYIFKSKFISRGTVLCFSCARYSLHTLP